MGGVSREASWIEERAAAIVAGVTGCCTCRLDLGTGPQQPDYALLDSAGREIGVLEVTSSRPAGYDAFGSPRNKKHREVYDDRLQRQWLATVDRADRKLSGLRKRVVEVLMRFEATGVDFATFWPDNYLIQVERVPGCLRQEGVVELWALSAPGTGKGGVVFHVQAVGGFCGPINAVDAIEVELHKEDNRRKLKGVLERRELFVWLTRPSFAAMALSILSGERGRAEVAATRGPRLPSEATAVWAATWSCGAVRLADGLWRGDMNGWEVVEPPAALAGGL